VKRGELDLTLTNNNLAPGCYQVKLRKSGLMLRVIIQ
jgi:hypothetical protein